MPHLNELQDKFGEQGLSIIGVTGEAKSNTESWVRAKGVQFPYAYNKGSVLMKELGLTGLPSAVLVSPTGTIVWQGHPGNLQASEVEKNLEGALKTPLWNWPAEASAVKKTLRKKQYAKALAAAEALAGNGNAEGEAIRDAVKAFIAGKAAAVSSLVDKGDYLGATNLAKTVSKSLKGLPEAEEVKAAVARMKADKQSKKIISVQKSVVKLRAELPKVRRQKHAKEMISKLEKLAKKVPDTFAATQVGAFQVQLERMMQKLP